MGSITDIDTETEQAACAFIAKVSWQYDLARNPCNRAITPCSRCPCRIAGF